MKGAGRRRRCGWGREAGRTPSASTLAGSLHLVIPAKAGTHLDFDAQVARVSEAHPGQPRSHQAAEQQRSAVVRCLFTASPPFPLTPTPLPMGEGLRGVIPAKAGIQARSLRALRLRRTTSPSFQPKLEPILILIPSSPGKRSAPGSCMTAPGCASLTRATTASRAHCCTAGSNAWRSVVGRRGQQWFAGPVTTRAFHPSYSMKRPPWPPT